MTWQATFPVDMVRSQDDDLLTPTTYYASNGHSLTAVNLADGTIRQLMDEPDYALTPLGEQAGLLLVSARRERGTQRDELWAIDTTTGERSWQYVPQATERLGGASFSYSADKGLWTWQLTNQGVLVLQARSNPDRLVLETLQLRDGISTGQTTVSPSSLRFGFEVVGWHGSNVWLRIDNSLAVVDTSTSTLLANWP
jgi:hypothetical protein